MPTTELKDIALRTVAPIEGRWDGWGVPKSARRPGFFILKGVAGQRRGAWQAG